MTFERPSSFYTQEAVAPPNEVFRVGSYEAPLREFLQLKVYKDGSPAGAEALVRSAESTDNAIPENLLDHLKKEQAEHALTLAMFKRSCEQLAYWQKRGIELPLSVNIEVSELHEGVSAELDALIEETGAPRGLIELEVTERTRLTEEHRIVMEELRALGIRLALDDFGSGKADQESHTFFQPGDTVKIDRTLVEDGTAYDCARELLAQGFHVVIEGVPLGDLDKVPDGCAVQSFELSGEPSSIQDIEQLLLERRDEDERKAS